ncbi:LOW QUALITY PROTEIN: Pol polyprotein [Elysia marginata]|uniref:Pol polyprotein n=1 Tax=Elysia marginata TaxID=1093978 RepID=A0AAV4HCY4_9GAST|nr:LOW QUALITY PROTEIN: Pol polyprotein [Elysia marginata]
MYSKGEVASYHLLAAGRLEAGVISCKRSLSSALTKSGSHSRSLECMGLAVDCLETLSSERVKAIQKLKEPENVSELRTVLGMFNYMAKFVPQMSSILQPMSALLRKETSFLWGPEQQTAFDSAKGKISAASFMSFFDINKPTIVSADASSYGIGGALLQVDGIKIVPIAFVSRTLSNTEKHYAQIEKECLAAIWACEKFSRYLVGLPSFTLETDHRPLVPIMMKKDLDKTPIRCQRLLIRMMKFNARIIHKPGKELMIADTLSRFPLQCDDDTNIEETVTEYVDFLEDNIAITADISGRQYCNHSWQVKQHKMCYST